MVGQALLYVFALSALILYLVAYLHHFCFIPAATVCVDHFFFVPLGIFFVVLVCLPQFYLGLAVVMIGWKGGAEDSEETTEPLFCSQCGHPFENQGLFCGACGHPRPEQQGVGKQVAPIESK